MVDIIPSILSNDPDEAKSLLSLCEGVVSRAHIDIIDGIYAQNKTIDPTVFDDTETSVRLDYHLMVKEPIHWLEKVARAGADRIIGQIEMMESQSDFVESIITLGLKSGLALDVNTPISSLSEDIFSQVDVVLLMSVEAGFGGQKFDESVLEKIEQLHEIRTSGEYHFAICDDGGITLDTIALTRGAGVDEVAIGRRLFHGDLVENIDHFRKSAMR